MTITNLDGNPRPEMILMTYGNPTGLNTFRYKGGFNLNNDETAIGTTFLMKL